MRHPASTLRSLRSKSRAAALGGRLADGIEAAAADHGLD
jgi:hypothetical protein